MDKVISITAKITNIKYKPLLCKELDVYKLDEFDDALSSSATFILQYNKNNRFAISRWVSPKRTRSYPYARVYDSLNYSDKRITIIPILKDEGKDGDRDFLQWDTISLMSLLGVYVIIGYYSDAIPSTRYTGKITSQKFDIKYILEKLEQLTSYQSDPLHWNLSQIEHIWEVGEKALKSYRRISKELEIEMHSLEKAAQRIEELKRDKEIFMNHSRMLAELAQRRETITIQPREKLSGVKGMITIKNYLGGNYYLTSDEVEIDNNHIRLIDAKHTRTNNLPSIGDIKEGLLKMILFTNLEDVTSDGIKLLPTPVLKLTTGKKFNINKASTNQINLFKQLKDEAKKNNFKILLNNDFIDLN